MAQILFRSLASQQRALQTRAGKLQQFSLSGPIHSFPAWTAGRQGPVLHPARVSSCRKLAEKLKKTVLYKEAKTHSKNDQEKYDH